MLDFSGTWSPKEIVLACIRWYAAYSLSYRNLEDMRQERGVSADHSTVKSRATHFRPLLERTFRKHKRPVGVRWPTDETYIKV